MTDTLRPGTAQEAGLDPVRMDRIRDLCQSWVKDGTHPALVVLVARRGVIALREAYGVTGPEPDAGPLAPDAIFPMASISKLIVAAVLMTLVDDGLVGLTRPVQEYIPEFTSEGKDQVCVHHLLTHTSGLKDEDIGPKQLERLGEIEVPEKEKTEHGWVHSYLWLAYDLPLSTPPGLENAYCTFNYDLLGEIVRRVTQRRFTDVCHERLFAPLGMDDTYYVLPDELFARAVRRERQLFAPGLPPADSQENRRLPLPSGGVFSTARDMAVFVQMFLNGGTYGGSRILSRSTVEEMTRNQIPGIPSSSFGQYHAEASWGYGWTIGRDKWTWFPTFRMGSFNHMGGSGTLVWGDPHDSVVGVYFSVPAQYMAVPESTTEEPVFNADLFANAVGAAVAD